MLRKYEFDYLQIVINGKSNKNITVSVVVCCPPTHNIKKEMFLNCFFFLKHSTIQSCHGRRLQNEHLLCLKTYTTLSQRIKNSRQPLMACIVMPAPLGHIGLRIRIKFQRTILSLLKVFHQSSPTLERIKSYRQIIRPVIFY